MFNKLFELEKQRTASEAFGFYIAYLGIVSLLGFFTASVLYGWDALPETDFDPVRNAGANFAVVFSIVLTAAVAYKKSAGFFGMVLTFLAGGLSIAFSGALGMIPAAFLTTRPRA